MPRPRPWTCPSLNCTSAYDRRTLLCRHLERVHNLLVSEEQMNNLFGPHPPRAQAHRTAGSRQDARARRVPPPKSRDYRVGTVEPRRRHPRPHKRPRGPFRRRQDPDDSVQEIIDVRSPSPEPTPCPPPRPAGFSYAAALSPDTSPEPEPPRALVPAAAKVASTHHGVVQSSEASLIGASRDKGKEREVIPETRQLLPTWATRTPPPIFTESPRTKFTPLSAISSTLNPAPWRLSNRHRTESGGDADDELSEEDQLLDDEMESPTETLPGGGYYSSSCEVKKESCEENPLPHSSVSILPAPRHSPTSYGTEESAAVNITQSVYPSPQRIPNSNLEFKPFDPSTFPHLTRRVHQALGTKPLRTACHIKPDKGRSKTTDIAHTRSPASSFRKPGPGESHQQKRRAEHKEPQGEQGGCPSAEDEAMVEVAVDVRDDAGSSSEETCILERPYGYRKRAQSRSQRGERRGGL